MDDLAVGDIVELRNDDRRPLSDYPHISNSEFYRKRVLKTGIVGERFVVGKLLGEFARLKSLTCQDQLITPFRSRLVKVVTTIQSKEDLEKLYG